MTKPIVINSPWWKVWRHPVFPWGWISLRKMKPQDGETVTVSGYHAPGDGRGGVFEYRKDAIGYVTGTPEEADDCAVYVPPNDEENE